MKYYQIFYNSSANSLAGPAGFGVRTATAGTPQEYIHLVAKDGTLRSYSSGKFSFPNASKTMMETPEMVYEYPRRFFYRQIVLSPDKTVYVAGRVVSTVFDHEFYSSGRLTRPGNYVSHLFFFEEFPGKDIFSLFQGGTQDGALVFKPLDWTPVQDNPELRELMLGKPEPLAADDKALSPLKPSIPVESIDLFFSYKEALSLDQKLMVSLKEEAAAAVCSGLMYLLPESLAKEATFELNHQLPGCSLNTRMSFVNEYYGNPIYENTCYFVDFIKDKRTVTSFEAMWRPMLEEAIAKEDFVRVAQLTEWICGDIAAEYIGSPQSLNAALFEYCCNPDGFKIEDIDNISGILPALNKAILSGKASNERLMELLADMFVASGTLEEYMNAIRLSRKVASAGIDIQPAVEVSRREFTGHLLASYGNVVAAVDACEPPVLMRFADSGRLPELKDMLPEILGAHSMTQVLKTVVLFVPEASERVNMYVNQIKEYPEKVTAYAGLLENDRFEADKVDYISEFSSFLDNEDFIGFFFRQIVRELPSKEPLKAMKQLSSMALCNRAFAMKLFAEGSGIYATLYEKILNTISESRFDEVKKAVESQVLDLIPEDMVVRRQWTMLYDVLSAKVPEPAKMWAYYSLAARIDCKDALRAIAPQCVSAVPAEEISNVLTQLTKRGLQTEEQILEQAAAMEDVGLKQEWLKETGLLCGYTYDRLEALSAAFGFESSEAFDAFVKENFNEEYNLHRKEVRKEKVKKFCSSIGSLFSKKKDGDASDDDDEPDNDNKAD